MIAAKASSYRPANANAAPRAWRNESRTSGSSTCSTTAPTEKSSGGRPLPVRTARNSLPAPRRIDSAGRGGAKAASLSSVSAVSSRSSSRPEMNSPQRASAKSWSCLGSLGRISVMLKGSLFACLEMSALASSYECLRCEWMVGAESRCSRQRQALGLRIRSLSECDLRLSRNPVSATACELPRRGRATEQVSQPAPLRVDRARLLRRGGRVAAGPQTGCAERKLHPNAFDRSGTQQTFSTAG